MANQSNENGELFELNKDLNGSSASSEHLDLENQLSKFSDTDAPSHLKNAILAKVTLGGTSFMGPTFLMMAAALFIIVGSGYYFLSKPKKETTALVPLIQTKEEPKIANIFEKELGVDSIKTQKYYAIYFSSTLCKPCADLLGDLDRFYTEQKSKNPDFEMVYIELNKNAQINESLGQLHFKTVIYGNLKDKPFFKQFKEDHGPAFVVFDGNGKVVLTQKKDLQHKSFGLVLTAFSNLLAKS